MADDGPSLCARCAASGRTCCQDTQVFLSRGDVRRVAAEAPGEEFSEHAAPADENYRPDFTYDSVWGRIFGPDGRRRVLRHRGSGDCWFLTATGCRLSLDARPLVCRLYPFDYNETAIKGVHGHICPEPERHSAPLLLALLAMNRSEAEGWRRLLYEEILEEFPLP